VEAAFIISSMLFEMPNICAGGSSSKFFKKMIENYEKNHFVSMESNKDIIYFAALALEKGEWRNCYDLLM